MDNTIAIVSLLFLVAAIVIGFIKNINTGLFGMSFALICGVFICGIKAKTVIGYWPQSLCMAIMGMTFMFAIARRNGTLTLVSEFITGLVKGKTKLLPFCFYLIGFGLAVAGVAVQANTAIAAPICISIGNKARIKNLDVAICLYAGTCAGTLNSINPSGNIAKTLGEAAFADAGVSGVFSYNRAFIATFVIMTVIFIAAYFIRGMFRFEDCVIEKTTEKINKQQIITLVVVGACLLSIILFKTDTGLTAFLAGTLLLLLNIGEQGKAISDISWSTVILVGGMTLMISVVDAAGGITLLSDLLSGIMGKNTAGGIMCMVGGTMSAVSSASGVVMPTLIPTIPGIMQNVPGIGFYPLFIGIIVGAHAITISPLSTVGSLCLASSDEDKKAKLFFQQFIAAIIMTVLSAVLVVAACVVGII